MAEPARPPPGERGPGSPERRAPTGRGPAPIPLRLHRSGRFRAWLGARLGGDAALGDRAWRRILHALGAAVLVYEVVPERFFVIAGKEWVLLAALAAVLVLEALRHTVGLELPTIRPYESHRVGSFAFYAVALVLAVLLFPLPIAAAIVLGTALVDPLAGELRIAGRFPGAYPAVPLVAYSVLAWTGLAVIGSWPALPSAGLAVLAAPIAVVAEGRKIPWVDDDLAMTLVPGLVLYVLGALALGLPR